MQTRLYRQVIKWIPEGAHVLDLGTGNGLFLEKLIKSKKVSGEGVEKNREMVAECIDRGLIVHHGDILDGLDQYDSGAFEYVLLLGTFEELEHPVEVLREAFRVGEKVIISYRNFFHWKIRFQIVLNGRAPRTPAIPEEWYDAPTVHFFSVKDFRTFCKSQQLKELRTVFLKSGREVRFWPNCRAEVALSLLSR